MYLHTRVRVVFSRVSNFTLTVGVTYLPLSISTTSMLLIKKKKISTTSMLFLFLILFVSL